MRSAWEWGWTHPVVGLGALLGGILVWPTKSVLKIRRYSGRTAAYSSMSRRTPAISWWLRRSPSRR